MITLDLKKDLKHLYNPSAKQVSLVQVPNSASLMLVTLWGIVTLVSVVQSANAPGSMAVTGKVAMLSGMLMAPPGPV